MLFFLSRLIFVNISGQVCSANLSRVSPAWFLSLSPVTVSACSAVLFSDLTKDGFSEPFASSFIVWIQIRNGLSKEQVIACRASRGSVLSLWWDLKNPNSYILQLVEVSVKFTQLRRGGRFSLVNFLLHLICFLPAYHKGNSSLSLKSVSLPRWGASTWVFLLAFLHFAPVLPGDVLFPVWGQ